MVSDNPLVSVIMPVYNCEKYVAEAIRSIIEQTYQNWELLVCDDRSSDKSVQIVEDYSLSNPRITLCVNSHNRGAAYSRNLLIEKARGKFIALMDADDISDPNRISAQLDFIDKNRLHGCGTNHVVIGGDGGHIGARNNYTGYEQIVWSAFNSFRFCHSSLLVERACIVKIGGYKESLRTESEDSEMLSRLLIQGYKIETLNNFFYKYRLHGENVSFRLKQQQTDNSFFVTKNLLDTILGFNTTDDFARFMRYHHRSEFDFKGDCIALFDGLCRLIRAIEDKVLGHKVHDRVVKLDVSRKMLFLFLKHWERNRLESVSLLFRSVAFCPTVLEVLWENIRRKLFMRVGTVLSYLFPYKLKKA